MYLLMNTCGEESVFALGDGAGVCRQLRMPARESSEGLLPAVRRLLDEAELDVSAIRGVGVVHGPGSFTGARVGLSAAKGLCQGLGVPLVAMSRLALVAAEREDVSPQRSSAETLALLDAGRGEFYAGLYTAGGWSEGRPFTPRWERMMRRDEVERLLEAEDGAGAFAITCERRVAEALGPRMHCVEEPRAEQMLRTTLQRAERGAWSDLATTDANYLRRTDAELLVESRLRDAGEEAGPLR